jgi:hypothetical protein
VIYEQRKELPFIPYVVGNIRMRSAAGGAQIPVKHTAVNASSLLENIP